MDESFGTKIPLPLYLDLPATTYVKGASEACAKMGGAFPVLPKSILPAFNASAKAGPAWNSFHSTVYP